MGDLLNNPAPAAVPQRGLVNRHIQFIAMGGAIGAGMFLMLPSLVLYSMSITGQVCFSLTRVLVPRSRRDEIAEAYIAAVKRIRVGDPFEDGVGMGPLTTARQRERVESYINKGRAEGARLALGGGRPAGLERGFYVSPRCSWMSIPA